MPRYTDAQIEALSRLVDELQAQVPSLRFIAGHEDLDTTEVAATDDPDVKVRRKRDPGPMFPWDRVMAGTGLVRLP